MSSMCSLLLLLGLAIVVAGKVELPKNIKIFQLKQKSEQLSAKSSSKSVECFDYYRPQFESISDQYQGLYENCVIQYEADTILENSKWEVPRQRLEQSGVASCNVLQDCSSIVGYVEAFECFAASGANQSKTMYQISANATELSIEVEEYYKTIESRKSICINNAERYYVGYTTETYENLNLCLAGKVPIPETTRQIPETTRRIPEPTTTTPLPNYETTTRRTEGTTTAQTHTTL